VRHLSRERRTATVTDVCMAVINELSDGGFACSHQIAVVSHGHLKECCHELTSSATYRHMRNRALLFSASSR